MCTSSGCYQLTTSTMVNNEARKILANALISKTKLQERQHAFELRQLWDPEDQNIFLKKEKRYTSHGLYTFFKALDRTVMFANTVANKAKAYITIPFPLPGQEFDNNDRKPDNTARAVAGNQQFSNKNAQMRKKGFKPFWKFQSKGQRLPKPPQRQQQEDAGTEDDDFSDF